MITSQGSSKEARLRSVFEELRAEQDDSEAPLGATALAISHLEEALRQLEKRARQRLGHG